MEVSELLGMLGTGGGLEGDSLSPVWIWGSNSACQACACTSYAILLTLRQIFFNIYFHLFLHWHAYLVLTAPPHLTCIHLHPQLFHCQIHVFSASYCFWFWSQPLPEKFIVKGMVERFNDDFIETRRKALHKFLNRIADHPTLTFNEDFKVFLTAQAWVKGSILYS